MSRSVKNTQYIVPVYIINFILISTHFQKKTKNEVS